MRRACCIARGLARTILAQPGIEGDPLAFLDVSEAYWRALRHQKHEPHKKGPKVVTYAEGPLPPPTFIAPAATQNGTGASVPASPGAVATGAAEPIPVNIQPPVHDYDVVICGGTLGLFLATALQLRGWRVAIVEKRLVQVGCWSSVTCTTLSLEVKPVEIQKLSWEASDKSSLTVGGGGTGECSSQDLGSWGVGVQRGDLSII